MRFKHLLVFLFSVIIPVSAFTESQKDFLNGLYKNSYLFKTTSRKNLIESAQDHQWSINFHKHNGTDTLHVIAIRIEFNDGDADSSVLTTGNGLFGINGRYVKDERKLYDADTIYKYDALPHDSLYFVHQLETVKQYYSKVSRGRLALEFSLYPSGDGETGYRVPEQMTTYSPGAKKKKESWDEYYARKTKGLMQFIKDAIESAAKSSESSPFANLRFNSSDSTIRDENNHKTVFLIIHAGSSYLTDANQDTPSDMIDVFINKDFFHYYKDSLSLSSEGITVQGKSSSFVIDEVMMCSETSNQDGINWGIKGVLVNQIARQLGIPDLFYGGISGVGAFCIMDFAGYSAGQGFIPPYPSAWVRAYMGWDDVKVAAIGSKQSYNIKSLTSVLDRNPQPTDMNDTTILLVPINDHEYYLLENRQRNLEGNPNFFKYDTSEGYDPTIASYPNNINVDSCVLSSSNESNVIQKVRNNDVSLPASGVLVWHVDENIIRERISSNMLNADSSYRGISLVEADGVTDLGVEFSDMFYQAIFDYGGAEDIFPHETSVDKANASVIKEFGPFTSPSTRSNDGGQTYLNISIDPVDVNPQKEYTLLMRGSHKHKIADFSDSLFSIKIFWNYLVPSWPKQAAADDFYDPLLVNLDTQAKGKELFLLSKKGYAYAWSADTSVGNGYNQRRISVDRIDYNGDTLKGTDTLSCLDSLPNVANMPSTVSGRIMLPSKSGKIFVLGGLSIGSQPVYDTINLPSKPVTYVCNYHDSSWAVGCNKGRIIFGKGKAVTDSLKFRSDSSICALAAIHESSSQIAVIQTDGTLSLCNSASIDTSIKVPGIGPYTLVTGDLNKDSTSEIVVCDNRHGVWVYNKKMTLAPGWEERPSDWPSVYSLTSEEDNNEDRSLLPVNTAPAALADINRDGYLDIVIGGTNGLYAFNYKGVLINGWPAYLDKRYWFARKSVVSSPIIAATGKREPLVLFSSTTGEKVTFTIAHVTSANRAKGVVHYRMENGIIDSLSDLTPPQIDTILKLNDSTVYPYVCPGGFIDAVNGAAKRPASYKMSQLQSNWPLTAGSPLSTSPMIGDMDNDKVPDLIAVSSSGWVYRWNAGKELLPDTVFWPQTGYDDGRSFAYGGESLNSLTVEKEPISFYNYPNPTAGSKKAVFRFKFSGSAKNVRLDIFSETGFVLYSKTNMETILPKLFPDWNEHIISLDKFGPGVYRCRLEATIDGKKHHKYWKMAVVK